jgi:hypothetical protein
MGKPNTSLMALNEMLFQQLEAVSNPDLSSEEFEKEKERAEVMAKLGKVMVENASVELKALETALEYGDKELITKSEMFLGAGNEKENV